MLFNEPVAFHCMKFHFVRSRYAAMLLIECYCDRERSLGKEFHFLTRRVEIIGTEYLIVVAT